MSLTALGAPMPCPAHSWNCDRGPSTGSAILDADGEKCGAVFQIPKTGTLVKIGVRAYTVTVSENLRVSLQTVDSNTGQPTGTLYKTGAFGIATGLTSNDCAWVVLNSGNGIAVTAGDTVAIVIEFESYVSGNLGIRNTITNAGNYAGFPYGFTYLGGTWTFLGVRNQNFGLEYSGGEMVYLPHFIPGSNPAAVAYNSGSNPDRRGLAFSLPWDCRISHLFAIIDLDGDASLILYDSDGITALATVALDTHLRGSDAQTMHLVTLATPIELDANEVYRLVVLPGSATNISITNHQFTLDGSYNPMEAMEFGTDMYYTTCNGEPGELGDWTDDLKKRPSLGVMVDQIEMGGRRPRAVYKI